MFYNNIDPVLLSLGPLEIRYYGLVYVLGFLLVFFVLQYYRKHGELDMSDNDIYDLLLYVILGIVIGSRVVHILFWNPTHYLSYPLDVFALWKGGMAFHGGLIGVVAGVWLYCRKRSVNLWKIADILSIPALIALAVGRLANFTNHELYGPVTDASWCVVFNTAEGCRHPYQIYSFLKRMIVACGLWFLLSKRKTKKFKDGFIFWNLVVWVNLGRFAIDLYRVDERWLGLTAGQYISAVLFVVGIVVLLKYHWKDIKNVS